MLYKDNTKYYNGLSILDECMYLTEEESNIHPQEIPVVLINENTAYVRYDQIESFMEDSGLSLDEARYTIADCNDNLNPDILHVAINEYDAIAYPEILREMTLEPIIIPISEDDIAYQFCETCINAFAESEDETWLDCLLEEKEVERIFKAAKTTQDEIDHIKKFSDGTDDYISDATDDARRRYAREVLNIMDDYHKENAGKKNADTSAGKKNADTSPGFFKRHYLNAKDELKSFGSDIKGAWGQEGIKNKAKALGSTIGKHKAVSAAIAGTAVAGGVALKKFVDYRKRLAYEAANKPKTWIAKKIASLRSIYQKYLTKAKATKVKGPVSLFKKIASVILSCIDFLLRKLQQGTDRIAGYKTNPR